MSRKATSKFNILGKTPTLFLTDANICDHQGDENFKFMTWIQDTPIHTDLCHIGSLSEYRQFSGWSLPDQIKTPVAMCPITVHFDAVHTTEIAKHTMEREQRYQNHKWKKLTSSFSKLTLPLGPCEPMLGVLLYLYSSGSNIYIYGSTEKVPYSKWGHSSL